MTGQRIENDFHRDVIAFPNNPQWSEIPACAGMTAQRVEDDGKRHRIDA